MLHEYRNMQDGESNVDFSKHCHDPLTHVAKLLSLKL